MLVLTTGPYLQGPPTEAAPDKPRYVDLKFYLGWKGKTIATLTHDDVRLLSCLPRQVSGYTLGVNQFGFYAKGPDGKYKTLSDDMADRNDALTLVDLQHIPFVSRAARRRRRRLLVMLAIRRRRAGSYRAIVPWR